ncbi:hypothetical protein CDAR_397211 [Caerostris darwini]|uniref:Uncharacterized protein n=1 Tax=Caerostris darwini TaxID=1538125 RepID=A0AAV4U5R7_9ARAC|nr:hypothetical protein CDAR_397211 [Caerostris darwini]
MSDDTETFHNARRLVFGEPNKRLLCAWHVDRSCRRKIVKLNIPQKQQIEVLRYVLCQIDENAFEITISEALRRLEENDLLKEIIAVFVQKLGHSAIGNRVE